MLITQFQRNLDNHRKILSDTYNSTEEEQEKNKALMRVIELNKFMAPLTNYQPIPRMRIKFK